MYFKAQIAKAPADPYGASVAENAADFTQNGGNGISGKSDVAAAVIACRRLHQTFAPRLIEIVILDATPHVTASAGVNQSDVFSDKLFLFSRHGDISARRAFPW